MINLDFGSLATTQAVSTNNRLRAWNIYENVKFDGIEGPVTGTGQTGNEWKAYDFKFSCPEGIYVERIFEPTEKSIERRSFPNANGHDVEMPSDWERTRSFIAQLVAVYNPEGYKVLQENSSKIKSFEQMIALVSKLMEGCDTTTSLKLAGRNNNGTVYATLPRFVSINSKTHECYTSDNFVGDKVAFSAWELKQKNSYESAKPTEMTDTGVASLSEDTPVASNDEDIDSLLNGL